MLLKLNFCFRNLTSLRTINNKSANWSNDAIKCYYARTCEQLYNLTVDDCYTAGMCCDCGHCDMIDTCCNDIISVLSRSTVWHDNEGSKQSNSNVKRNCEPQKLKLNAKEKHRAWLNNGSPKVGNIYNDMLIARKLYKNEIKNVKLKERMKKCKYVERLLNEKCMILETMEKV